MGETSELTVGSRSEGACMYDPELTEPMVQQPERNVKVKSSVNQVAAYTTSLLSGMIFGSVIFRSGVNEALVLRDQFTFQSWVMMKLFLAATGTSILVIQVIHAQSLGAENFGREYRESHRGLWAAVLGTFLLGSGMALSGTCPGTLWAQVGSGGLKAWAVMGGGLLGAGAFSLAHNPLESLLSRGKIPESWATLDAPAASAFGIPRWVVASVLGFVFIALSVTLEVVVPWQGSGAYPANFDMGKPWVSTIPPAFGGVIIGLLQLPLASVVQKTLGSSSSFVTIIANLLHLVHSNDYLQQFKHSLSNYWQVVYVLGACMGSLLGRLQTDRPYHSDGIVTWTEAALGGFVLVFGARLANGCTSGHGISGVGHLSTTSLLAVASMFSGALATGYLLKQL